MKTFGRRRDPEGHPGLKQVDRLLSGRPEELEVPICGLPGRLAALFSIYEDLFELRNYRVVAVDRRRDDIWIARLAPHTKAAQALASGTLTKS